MKFLKFCYDNSGGVLDIIKFALSMNYLLRVMLGGVSLTSTNAVLAIAAMLAISMRLADFLELSLHADEVIWSVGAVTMGAACAAALNTSDGGALFHTIVCLTFFVIDYDSCAAREDDEDDFYDV